MPEKDSDAYRSKDFVGGNDAATAAAGAEMRDVPTKKEKTDWVGDNLSTTNVQQSVTRNVKEEILLQRENNRVIVRQDTVDI